MAMGHVDKRPMSQSTSCQVQNQCRVMYTHVVIILGNAYKAEQDVPYFPEWKREQSREIRVYIKDYH